MDIARIDTVRKAVGSQKIEILTDIFKLSDGVPPGLAANRYRADHPKWIDILDRLQSEQLFLQRQERNPENYRVKVYALPILKDWHAQEIVQWMDRIFAFLKSIYQERMSTPVAPSEIIEMLRVKQGSSEEASIIEAFLYMTDGHSVWSGLTTGFPYTENSTICIAESVLRYDDFSSIIDEFYDWHILNPKKRVNASYATLLGDANSNSANSLFGLTETSRPEWYDGLDDKRKALIGELDVALRNGLAALPAMGLRSLLESIMLDHIGGDKGTFRKNLQAFTEAGYITRKHAEILEHTVETGHAAIHRAYFPNPSDIQTCLKVVKHLMEGVYILKPAADAMSEKLPKRET